ncbi:MULTISPECIES: S8 family serine peptidase [unclassified Granulicatella]|uniref:S8 family serine peptidase n=1 Tax=unclassified Granulicatella TaxID=2630493 RepID=UPI0010733CC3|nr:MULTISPECIES: S8 family serine peptidase [unclassified Granulicatella]MBF0780980.1 S8 family serine peptidase [Granulicatella sp. 19428wC4_WM01]TFU92738.1 peptidase S8 [Granulicatella sp. WM01]
MSNSKKWKSILLTSVLLLGSISPTVVPFVPRSVQAQEVVQAKQTLSNVSENQFKDTDIVKVIVKLKESSVNPDLLKTQEGRNQRKESTKPLRLSVLEDIRSKGITYQKLFEYDLLFNGFALELTYAQAKQIQALDQVESVEVSVDYEAPKVDVNSTILPPALLGKAIDSNNMIDVQALWDKGIKGQGQVVAVIDSGIDPSHDVLNMTDMTNAKYPTAASIQKAKETAGINYGKWYNDKLVFAFNYADWNDDLKEKNQESHGMHVSGTAVGNPSKPAPNGDYVAGVAPESQLMFMRVFSDKLSKGTSSFIYIKAIEDAVALGADSINMSLGAASGSVIEVGDAVNKAIELARQSGVTVVIAAGNSGVFGTGYAKPFASNPDYGLVGNPSVAYESISVAAINNIAVSEDVMTVKQLVGHADFPNGKGSIRTYATLFDPTHDYEYVYVNLGKKEDFNQLDLSGKIALIQRGEITFTEKVTNAKNAGAEGVVIFNHQAGGNELPAMALNGMDKDYPIVSIGHSYGMEIAKHSGSYTLTFDGSKIKRTSEKGNTLTDFTSWGLSSDGELKPDVTAPGGDIYSSYNNGTYGLSNGTSMASPHVAGAVALVKQVLKQRFPNKTAAEIQALVKHLLMSTAKVNINNDTKALTSPRQQGAGLIDAARAATGDLYVTGTNDYGSISLGNVAESFEFDVVVHNLSNQDRQLNYTTYVNTDEVSEGNITLNPRQLFTQNGESTLTVPANSSASVKIRVDTSQYTAELQKLMPNGYYLEGFVKFSDATTQLDEVSIPYVAFKGNFQDLAVLEKPIYDFTGEEKPFYYYANKAEKIRDKDNHVTALVSSTPSEQGNIEIAILGEYADEQENPVFDRTKLAFSPNNDNKQDIVALKAVILRNFENLSLSVYAKDDVNRERPLYTYGNMTGRKTYYDNGQAAKSYLIHETIWNGEDDEGNKLPDGEYQYVVKYRPESSAGKVQETSFLVKIDTVAPKIEDITSQYNANTRQFNPTNIEENGSGIYKKQLVYIETVTTPEGEETVEGHEIHPNADGSYTIPENVELKDVLFKVVDFAANETSIYLDGTLVQTEPEEEGDDEESNSSKQETPKLPEGKGAVEVKLNLDEQEYDRPVAVLRYKITDEAGNIVGDIMSANNRILHTLPYGKYTVEIVLLDEEVELIGERVAKVELTEQKPKQDVLFEAKSIVKNKMTVRFDKLPPANTKVYAVNQKGEKFSLPQSKYDPFVFEKRIVNGQYTFVVEMPEGYETDPTKLTYQVEDAINVLNAKLVEPTYVTRVATLPEKTPVGEVELSQQVLNTTHLVVDEINDANVIEKLRGSVINVENIERYQAKYYDIYLSRNNNRVKVDGSRTVSLQGLNKVVKIYHEKEDGTLELLKHQSTEDKVTFTVSSFSHFVVLTEKEAPVVTKEALQKAVDGVETVLASDAYVYDSVERKTAYNDAVTQARQVLNDSQATQQQIDDALSALNSAKQALVGQAPKPQPNESSSTTENSSETSESSTSSAKQETSESSTSSAKQETSESSTSSAKQETSESSTSSAKQETSESSTSSAKQETSESSTSSAKQETSESSTSSAKQETSESSTSSTRKEMSEGRTSSSKKETNTSKVSNNQELPFTGQAQGLTVVGVMITLAGGTIFMLKRKRDGIS